MSMEYRPAEDVARELMANDTTISPIVGINPPTSGYVVGIAGQGIKGGSEADVTNWVTMKRARTVPFAAARWSLGGTGGSGAPKFLGSWTDNGTKFYDVVKVYPDADKEEAMQEAKRTGEEAVYDMGADQSIYVKDYFKDSPGKPPWTHPQGK